MLSRFILIIILLFSGCTRLIFGRSLHKSNSRKRRASGREATVEISQTIENNNEKLKLQMDSLISNDLSDSGGTTLGNPLQRRIPLQNIFLYEIYTPAKLNFKKGAMHEEVECFHSKDEEALNNILTKLNDLMPGKKTDTIYNVYKRDINLQRILRIGNFSGTRTQQFARNQKIALFYILRILKAIAGSPVISKAYDTAWDRPVLYRLQSLRRHLLKALTIAIQTSTQDIMIRGNGEIACKKYLQIQTLIPVATNFLSSFSRCVGNNFVRKSDKINECSFDFTFPDLFIANAIEKETKKGDNTVVTPPSSLLEEKLALRRSTNSNQNGDSIMSKTLQKKSPENTKSFAGIMKTKKTEKKPSEPTKSADMADVMVPDFNKQVQPVIMGKINLLSATKKLYKKNDIVHDNTKWFILIDEKQQDKSEAWAIIPILNVQFANTKGYRDGDIAVFSDKVYMLDDVENQNQDHAWFPISLDKTLILETSKSNLNMKLHTRLPIVYGEFNPTIAESNGYEANSIVYLTEARSLFILTNVKEQDITSSWKKINRISNIHLSKSSYNTNDLVISEDNRILLLKTPFDQMNPNSWMEIDTSNVIMDITNDDTVQNANEEIEKKIKLIKKEKENEIEEMNRGKQDLMALKNKMLKSIKAKSKIFHQYPVDKCVYQAFNGKSPSMKQFICGKATNINVENGINIFEIPLHSAGLNPYLLNSKNFKYGITDRCGRLEKYVTVSLRDAKKVQLPNGRIVVIPPKLVAELDCYNHDCKIFMCNQKTGMARVISGNLYVYRDEGKQKDQKDNSNKQFVAQYEINAKGTTFTFELIQDVQQLNKEEDMEFIETTEVKVNNKNIGQDLIIANICTKVKELAKEHPDATKSDVDNYLHETYSMTKDELVLFYEKCPLDEQKKTGVQKKTSSTIKTEIGKICKNVKKMAMQYPDATENDIFKYLEIEYNMNSNEMELFHKECLVEEEVKKTRRTSETINKKNENLKSFVNLNRSYDRYKWLKTSQEC